MIKDEIIQDILSGNRDRFREIVESNQRRVFQTCMGFVHNRTDAEDLTQEVFISAYQKLHTFKGQAALETWLTRIAINTSLNFIRNKKKWGFIERIETLFSGQKSKQMDDLSDGEANPELSVTENESSEAIQKALDSLPENQRVAFVLSKYDELPQKEIAATMGLTEGAVEALIHRAKSNLQRKLITLLKK